MYSELGFSLRKENITPKHLNELNSYPHQPHQPLNP